MSSKLDIARDLVSKNKFFQLTAAWCPDCVYTYRIYDKFGIKSKFAFFDVADLDRRSREYQEYRDAFTKVAGGVTNLPTVFVNGKFWATEAEFLKWEKNGTLEQEFKKVGLL
ncbi:hypothetical protein ACO0RG_001490 [Hanseniaspora osmophila]|uniref:Glutaredoxin-8 n=1 Tax=Hanseniaspora osmophila TaxID=56408 RepID=A0A1E5R0F8_9ASCO|nr:Glutaredoxin-8 [Hanseniaspora osmophila]